MNRRAFLKWLVALLGVFMGGILWMNVRKWLPGGQSSPIGDELETNSSVPQASEKPAEGNQGQENGHETVKPAAEVLASFAILSDLHVSANDKSTSAGLRRALKDVTSGAYKPQALMLTGDVTDYGRDIDYKELLSVLKSFRLPPTHANMGNHDYYDIWINEKGQFDQAGMPHGKTDAGAREKFMKAFGYDRVYHDFWIGDCHFILLSMEAYMVEKPEYGEGAWYSDEQMKWLTAQMESHKDGKPAFIMIHQPLPPEGTPGRTHTVIRAQEFHAIMKDCPNVFVFCGHRHQDFTNETPHYRQESPNLHQFHNSSVIRVLKSNFQPVGGDKSQGMYVEVYADRVHLRGRDFANGAWLKEADWTIPLSPKLKQA